MNKILCIFILFLLFSCTNRDYKNYFEKATEAEKNENYTDAINFHKKVLKIKPDFESSLNNIASDYAAIDSFELAIIHYQKLLDIKNDYSKVLFNIGNNYQYLKNYDSAIVYYNKALNSEGTITISYDSINNRKLMLNSANININYDDFYSVEETEIYFARGFYYYQLNKNEESINDFKTCIKKGHSIADSYYFIGLNLLEMDKINESYHNLFLATKNGNLKAKEMLKDFK